MLNQYPATDSQNDPHALLVARVTMCIPDFPPFPFRPRDPRGLVIGLSAVQQLGVVVMW